MFNVSKLQSAGGKLTELLEQNYSIHCDQNNSKMILSHGKYFFFRKALSTVVHWIPDEMSVFFQCHIHWYETYVLYSEM